MLNQFFLLLGKWNEDCHGSLAEANLSIFIITHILIASPNFEPFEYSLLNSISKKHLQDIHTDVDVIWEVGK